MGRNGAGFWQAWTIANALDEHISPPTIEGVSPPLRSAFAAGEREPGGIDSDELIEGLFGLDAEEDAQETAAQDVLGVKCDSIGGDDVIVAQKCARTGFARGGSQAVEALAAGGFEMQPGAELESAGDAAGAVAKVQPWLDTPEAKVARTHFVAA